MRYSRSTQVTKSQFHEIQYEYGRDLLHLTRTMITGLYVRVFTSDMRMRGRLQRCSENNNQNF